jgi:hypothetical protein
VFILLNGSVKLETKLVPLKEAIGYTAPEKLKGGTTDHRGDVFSLGVVMWEALTHARLFSGATEAEMKTAVLESELHPPSEHNANIPSELDAICMKALARDPDQRHATAKALAVEIEGVLRDAGYGRTNEPIAAYVVKLPNGVRKRVGARATQPPPVVTPEPPKLESAVSAGLAAAPVESKPTAPKLPEDSKTSTIIGISSTRREPAKKPDADTLVDAPSLAKSGAGANTVMGVPSLAASLPDAKPGTATVMGVPSLAASLPDAKPGTATVMGVPSLAAVLPEVKAPPPSPAGSIPDMKAAEEPVLLTPKPPKLPNGPGTHKVPAAVAQAVTQAVPAAPIVPATAVDEASAESKSPDPAEAVSLPRAKSETGPQDQLNRWAWSTDSHPALDDDPLDDIPPPSKRPLFIAIGAAAGVLGLIAVIAFAAGGSNDKDKKDQQAQTETTPEQQATPPAEPAKPDQVAQAEPAKAEPSEPPKPEVASTDPVPPPTTAPTAPSTPDTITAAAPATPAPPPTTTPPPASPAPAPPTPAPPTPAPPTPAPPAPAPPTATPAPPPSVVAKIDSKVDAKTAAKTDVKTDPKVEAKTAKTDPKAAKTEPKTVARTDPKPAAKAEPPKPKTAAKTPPKPTRVATKAKPVDPYGDVPVKTGNAEASYRAGLQAFARGDTGSALTSLKSAANENPRFAPTYRGLGLVYEKMGDRGQAARAYRRYLQLAPNAGDAEVIRGRLERLGS